MKVWSVAKVNKERAIAMASKLEIPPLLAMLLIFFRRIKIFLTHSL